ncbi:two-component system, OmpR family, sensor histidine kinase ChvG [Loktanella fryxellensis]|uniref:histidine kinase n=1 Tax=Loktanella fryxellensis TaxID=245187 RepID=A0A1H8IKD5_9RHOB|nr:sensor histidine kinase [Loktanella fryxellensis]SEN68792.1 two-component system, OmpR family, sensor histidine kinase ChvG [Loktanella fryxellensis]
MADAARHIDVRDLNSVRRAARNEPELVLGDDWVAPQSASEQELMRMRKARRLVNLRSSPIARKIIMFNLLAMILLVAGVLYLNPSRDNLAFQRANGLVNEAELIADVLEARLPRNVPVDLASGDGIDVAGILRQMDLRGGIRVDIYSPAGQVVATATGSTDEAVIADLVQDDSATAVTDALARAWLALRSLVVTDPGPVSDAPTPLTPAQVTAAMGAGALVQTQVSSQGPAFVVSTPIEQGGRAVGLVSIASAAGELDALVSREREQVLRLFAVSIAVSIILSLVLASTIANPLADLAAAAEMGRDKNARKMSPTRVRIPDLTARPDEIGRLSGALRGMVQALYERIEGNEQFAADVAHEIKNPLASLRSAVGSLRIVKREDHREKLLEVIEHDVQRLDRLVSDISNASRLDSELVREEEETFDLLRMLGNLNGFLGKEAGAKGVDYISDLPDQPLMVQGLEGRLAQVFVNLITNAISFCEDGDAIRVWARKRENRILIVVEDTGPGIPDSALKKIFTRFYSQRPEGQFGNNSGLGLAISKQIVEAHGGVIWAENIRPTEADMTSDPLGARFVVGLPV